MTEDCIIDPLTDSWTTTLRECSTTPVTGSAAAMLVKLNSLPDLEGYLLERSWQTCEFEQDMNTSAAPLVELGEMLHTALL